MDWLKTMLVYLMLVTGTATLDAGATPVPYALLRTPTPVPTAAAAFIRFPITRFPSRHSSERSAGPMPLSKEMASLYASVFSASMMTSWP